MIINKSNLPNLSDLLWIIKSKLPSENYEYKSQTRYFVTNTFSIPFDWFLDYEFEEFEMVWLWIEQFVNTWSMHNEFYETIESFNKDKCIQRLSYLNQQSCFHEREKELSELFLELVDLCDEAISLYHKIIQENILK